MIFVSHSSRDLKTVRMIRNYLEDNNYDPILLHLGCMDSDAYTDMTDEELLQTPLFQLIRQEISARELFLYCDSEAAETSRYVQLERNMVAEQKEKAVLRIDLSMDEERIKDTIFRFLQCNTIFLHYCSEDRKVAEPLRAVLEEKGDVYIWTPYHHNLQKGTVSSYIIEKGINATREQGSWYIPVFSEALLKKHKSVIQSRLAEKNLRIIPLLCMDPKKLTKALPEFAPYANYSIDCRSETSPEKIAATVTDRIHKYNLALSSSKTDS